jgi:hypothetical protein
MQRRLNSILCNRFYPFQSQEGVAEYSVLGGRQHHSRSRSQSLFLRRQLRLLLRRLLSALDDTLGANATKHKTHAHPLLATERVAKPDNGENHGQHLSRHRDSNKEEGGECGECVDWFGGVSTRS